MKQHLARSGARRWYEIIFVQQRYKYYYKKWRRQGGGAWKLYALYYPNTGVYAIIFLLPSTTFDLFTYTYTLCTLVYYIHYALYIEHTHTRAHNIILFSSAITRGETLAIISLGARVRMCIYFFFFTHIRGIYVRTKPESSIDRLYPYPLPREAVIWPGNIANHLMLADRPVSFKLLKGIPPPAKKEGKNLLDSAFPRFPCSHLLRCHFIRLCFLPNTPTSILLLKTI